MEGTATIERSLFEDHCCILRFESQNKLSSAENYDVRAPDVVHECIEVDDASSR